MNSRERGETPIAESKAKMEIDLDKQWVWGGMGGMRAHMGRIRSIQKETPRRGN